MTADTQKPPAWGLPAPTIRTALRRLRVDRDRVARFLARSPRSGHRHRRDEPTSAGADDGLGLACGGGWTTGRCFNRRSPLPPIRQEDLFRDFFTLMARNGIEVGPPSAKGAGRTRPLRHGRLRRKRASPREGPDCPSRRFRPVGCIPKRWGKVASPTRSASQRPKVYHDNVGRDPSATG